MSIGPLEYVVIAIRSDQFMREVLPALAAIQAQGAMRVVDLVFVEKDEDGVVIAREIDQPPDQWPSDYASLAIDLSGLLTVNVIGRLAQPVPPGSTAVIALFEHTWTNTLRAAIDRAGGAALGGVLMESATIKRLEEEVIR